MGFQFIIGRQHKNRKDYIYNQLVDWIQEDATGHVFYLVPDHIKFESEMNILVINAGSSSLKYQFIKIEEEKVLAKGLCERIGIEGSKLTFKVPGNDD